MSYTIKVDKDVLEEQIKRLEKLYGSTDLHYDIQSILSFTTSSGDYVSTLKKISNELDSIDCVMKLLFGKTLDFLKNTHTNFVEADETTKEPPRRGGGGYPSQT